MYLHRLTFTLCLITLCAPSANRPVRADQSALPGPALSTARERFTAIRTSAMGYAYYLRSAYLRHTAIDPHLAPINRDAAREAVLSAVVYLKRALAYAPDSVSLWWEYAAINNGLGRVDDAIDAYHQLVRLDPGSALHTRLAILYELRKEPDTAVAHYRKALTFAPDDAAIAERIVDVYVDAGFSSLKRGDAGLAREQLLRALQELQSLLTPEPKARLLIKKGLIFEALEQYPDALHAYQQAIKLDPDDTETTLKVSRILYTLGEQAKRAGDSSTADTYFLDAADTFQTVLPRHAAEPDVLNYGAYVMALGGTNLSAAEELVSRALELDQSNGAYIDTLGWIYFRQGKFEQALRKVLRARELEGDDPVILEHLGDIYLQLGQPDKAREMWLDSLRFDAENNRLQRKLDQLP